MLRLGFVLLLATSAYAAPTIVADQYSLNEIGYTRNDGQNSYLIKRTFEAYDGGDLNIYIHNAQSILSDLANQPDRSSQASAFGQAIAVLGEITYGIPGDACAAGNYINAYAAAAQSGNYASVRPALNNFVRSIANNIDAIVNYILNPNASKYSFGPRSGCAGQGRNYRFEAAWQAAFATGSYHTGLMNEEYCLAKRMYYSFNGRTGNVGAILTASSLPPTTRVFELSAGALANFLNAVASGVNPAQAAAGAKQALSQAVSRVQL